MPTLVGRVSAETVGDTPAGVVGREDRLLNPARGIAIGIALGLVAWVLIGVFAWLLIA